MIKYPKYLLCFILIALAYTFIQGQETTTKRGAGTLQTDELEVEGNTRALIIGISDYNSEKLKLNFADNDAILFYLFLINNDSIDIDQKNVKLLLNKDATVDNILRGIEWLKNEASENDKTIIYFAGHADVVKVVDNEAGFFLTYHASDQREYRAGGAIPFSVIEQSTDSIASKGSRVWLITDACRSGTIINETGAKLSLTALNANFNKTLKIVSSKPSQFSYEYEDLKHGVFTYYLVQALMGRADDSPKDEELTADEIRDFMRKNVKSYTDKKQIPSLYTDDDDEILAFSNPVYLAINQENIDLLKAVYSEKTSGLFMLDMSFDDSVLNESEKLLSKKFIEALKENNLFGNDTSAWALYQISVEDQCNAIFQNVLKNNLINALNAVSQIAINKYLKIGAYDKGDKGLNKRAEKALMYCYELIDSMNLNYNTIVARKLFFEAYNIYSGKDYKNFSQAEDKLQQSLIILPNAAYTHNALGTLYYYWHNYDKAEFHLKQAVEAIPTWAKPLNNLANMYESQGRYTDALQQHLKVPGLDSTIEFAYNNIANIYLALGQYTKAEELYLKGLDSKISNTPLMNLGLLNERRGRFDLAEKYYKQAIEADTSDYDKYVRLGNYYLKHELKNELGLSYLQKSFKSDSGNPYYISELADYYSYYTNDIEEQKKAVDLYHEAMEIDPYYMFSYINMAWYYSNREEYTEAERYFQLAIDSIPYRAVGYYEMARFLTKRKKYKEAESYFMKAIEVNPYYYSAYSGYSSFLENEMSNKIKGEEILLKALVLFENSPDVTKDLGDFYYRSGDTTQAISYYEKTKLIDSSYAFSYSSLSLIYLKNSQFDKALANFKNAVELNPYKLDLNDFIRNIQSEALRLIQVDLEQAILGFKAILKEDPKNLIALKNLARIYYFAEKPKLALEYIEKCFQQDIVLSQSQEKQYLWMKGLILLDLKKAGEALELFEEVIKRSPMPTYLEKCVALLVLKRTNEANQLFEKEKTIPFSKLKQKDLSKFYSDNFLKKLQKLYRLNTE